MAEEVKQAPASTEKEPLAQKPTDENGTSKHSKDKGGHNKKKNKHKDKSDPIVSKRKRIRKHNFYSAKEYLRSNDKVDLPNTKDN